MRIKNLLLALITVLGVTAAKAYPGNGTEPDARGSNKRVNEINGTVVNATTKKPLENVSISAYETSKKEKVILTDSEGNYGFDELKPGIYKFVFEKPGFKRVTKDKVVIKTDEQFLMNIEMIEDNGTHLYPSPFHFMEMD